MRKADLDDSMALAWLRERWTAERGVSTTDSSFVDRFTAWMDDELLHRQFWLAEIDNEAVGMVNVLTFERMPRPGVGGSRWGYLANMYVVPEHRSAGVGRALAKVAMAEVVAAGCERVVLSPSEASKPFWARLGFLPPDELLVYRP